MPVTSVAADAVGFRGGLACSNGDVRSRAAYSAVGASIGESGKYGDTGAAFGGVTLKHRYCERYRSERGSFAGDIRRRSCSGAATVTGDITFCQGNGSSRKEGFGACAAGVQVGTNSPATIGSAHDSRHESFGCDGTRSLNYTGRRGSSAPGDPCGLRRGE
jgi:hypothetical protein